MPRDRAPIEVEFEIMDAVLDKGDSYGLRQARILYTQAKYPSHPLWDSHELWNAPIGVD